MRERTYPLMLATLVLAACIPGVNSDKDQETKRLVEQAKGGEVLNLKDGLVKRIIRFPWIGGTAVIATLDTEQDGKQKARAVLTQADCVFLALRETNDLGDEHLGSWKPTKRIDQMEAKVSIPTSVASPVPFLDLQKIIYQGKSFICHEVTAGEQLKRLLGKIDWKNIPEDLGSTIGDIAAGFMRGLRGS